MFKAPQWMPGDLSHDYSASLRHINGGKMDGFADTDIDATFSYCQQDQTTIPNYWHWESQNGLCDNFFASALGDSYPQQLYNNARRSAGTNNPPTPTQHHAQACRAN